MLRTFLIRFPKWAIAATISLGSTTLFCIWWFVIKPSEDAVVPPPVVETGAPQTKVPKLVANEDLTSGALAKPEIPPGSPVLPPASVEIDPATMLLGGKTLFQVKGETVIALRENFLQYPIKAGDQSVFHHKENRLVIGRANGVFEVIRANGETISALHLPGKGKFDGYLDPLLTHAVYVKNGDLWRGNIDWDTAQIIQEKQVTNLGYFLGNPLRGRLAAATGKSLLYRDHRLGLVGVNLATGETDSGQLPTNLATGPDGRLAIGDVPGRPPQLVVFDVDQFDTQSFPMPWRIPQNGLAWLSDTRAAVILTNQVTVYDHASKEVSQLYEAEEGSRTAPIVPSLVGEEFLFFQDSQKGILLLNTKTGETHQVRGPTAHGLELLHDGYFLLSSDVPGSEQRGTWLGKFGVETLDRLFAQPLHVQNHPQPVGQRFSMPVTHSNQAILHAFDRWHLLDLETKGMTDFQMKGRELISIDSP